MPTIELMADVAILTAKVARLEAALKCRDCGKTKAHVAICFDCLSRDVEEISRWHREVSVSDADGSWDECSQCHTGWPCDAIKAFRLRDEAPKESD